MRPSFKDKEGREWFVEINIFTVKQLKNILDFDILDTSDGSSFVERLADDPVLICDVVYLACRDQAKELGISDEDFGRSMSGPILGDALEALMQAIINFSHRSKNREALKKLWEKTDKVQEAVAEKIGNHYDQMDVEKVVNKICGELFTSSQELWE